MSKFVAAGKPGSLRAKLFEIIFGHDPGWGRRFDAILIAAIVASVFVVMFDSVAAIRVAYSAELRQLEWLFTILFTVEYLVRVWCLKRPSAYTLSFFGVIDLLSVLPTYVSLLLPGGQFLAVIRILRVVRVFRVFKLVRFIGEAGVLMTALRNARYKIVVFLVTVISIVVVVGSVMYIVEGPAAGFTSIPRGIYWAIVTLTTVGYGDIAPTSAFGQALAAFVMILGYGIIAVPTGIVTAELAHLPPGAAVAARPCSACGFVELDADARFCRSCGTGFAIKGSGAPREGP